MNVQTILTSSIVIPEAHLRESYQTRADERDRESIRRHGVQQPILVMQNGDTYDVIDGTRRVTFAKEQHIPKMQCVIEELPEGADRAQYMKRLRVLLDENQQDLSPSQRAVAYKRLIDEFGMSRQDIADILGINKDTIGNYLEVQHYIQPVKDAVDAGLIKMHAARAFRGLTPKGQDMILRVHAKELQSPSRSTTLHESIRKLYPPDKRPDIYVNPKDVAEKMSRPKKRRITKNYSHDEKRDLIRDVSNQTAELEAAKAEIRAIKNACIACAPVVNAILRNKALHTLAEVEPLAEELRAFSESY